MLRPFRSRDFRLFWSGSFVANCGVWMQQIALGWLVYAMTRSASWLGTISFTGNLPVLVFGLLGGAIVDRASRRTVILGSQTAFAVEAAVLALLTASGHLALWHVMVLAMCAGTALAIGGPAMFAVIPTLVGPEELLNAISLNSVQMNLARTLGPVLAGVVYGRVGPAACFGFNAAGFVVLTLVLSRIRMPQQPTDAPAPVGRAMRDGLRYARTHPVIGPALFLSAAVSLFGFPYLVLLPALARDTLHLEVSGLGYLMTTVGAGAVLAGLGLAAAGDLPHKGLIGIATAFLFGATLAAFGIVRSMHATMAVLFTLGVLQTLCMASINTTVQLAVDDRMRGRIMSMLTMILFGLTTLGGLLLGTLGDRIGVPGALAVGGVVIALAATGVLARAPVLQAAEVR